MEIPWRSILGPDQGCHNTRRHFDNVDHGNNDTNQNQLICLIFKVKSKPIAHIMVEYFEGGSYSDAFTRKRKSVLRITPQHHWCGRLCQPPRSPVLKVQEIVEFS
jgi:hypothetical protein